MRMITVSFFVARRFKKSWNPLRTAAVVALDDCLFRVMTLPVFAYSQYMNQGIPATAFVDRAWGAALVLIVIVMAVTTWPPFTRIVRAEALRVIRARHTPTDPPVWVSVPLIALAGWLVLTLLCLW